MKKRSILIFPNGGLGDLVQVSPLFQQAKTALPDASIRICVYNPRYRQALIGNPYLDGMVPYRLPGNTLGKPWRWRDQVRIAWFNRWAFRRYSHVFLAIPSLAEFSAFAGPLRWGSARHVTVAATLEQPLILIYQQNFARLLEIDFVYHAPRLYLTEEEKAEGRQWLSSQTRPGRVPVLLAYDTGTRDRMAPVSVLAEIADGLGGLGAEIFLLRGVTHPFHAAAIVSRARVPVRLVEGKTLRQEMAIIAAAQLCVSPLTGICHIAAALGVPTIILFGPSSLNFRPLENHVRAISKAAQCPYKQSPPEANCEHSPVSQQLIRIDGIKNHAPPPPGPRRCIHPEAGPDAAACMYWFRDDDLIPAIKSLEAVKLNL